MSDLDGLPSVNEVFGEMRRFHVYDHGNGEWVASGAEMPHSDLCVVDHVYSDGVAHFDSYERYVGAAPDELTAVWEDGEDSALESCIVDMDAVGEVETHLADLVAERAGVDPGRIRVTSLEPPNTVRYFVVADGDMAEET